ncbi:spermidine synthase [Trifolium medium]|uniref:Spermidine synthase n=1 Tax=Trifolium medium TaxID=97028 RepID=A0A392MP54_9FABA|nr:spermidine synthase [Trifolium medium]
MAAAENTVESTDFPVKRQREDEQLNNGVTVSEIVPQEPQPNGLSTVIPGWFSEISPMWPDSCETSRAHQL